MSTISVVIPAYNAERTILETIETVLQQTFQDFELIVINDGSTDQTVALLQTIEDQRLQVFSYPNAGAAIARNRGIAHSTSEYITFIDSDDLWTRDKLELQLLALQENPQAGLAYSWTCNMSPSADQFFPTRKFLYQGDVYHQLLVTNFLCCGSNCLIRRSAIEAVGEFDPTLKAAEDWDYWLRLAAHTKFVVVPKYQIFYRLSSEGLSSNAETLEHYSRVVLDRVFQTVPTELQGLKNQSLSILYQYLAMRCLSYVKERRTVNLAWQYLQRSIRYYPKILLERLTQGCCIKCLLMIILSPQLARHLIRPIRSIMLAISSRQHPNFLTS